MAVQVASHRDLSRLLIIRRQFLQESSDEQTIEARSQGRSDKIDAAIKSYFHLHLNSPLSRTWVFEADRQFVSIGTLTFFFRQAIGGVPAGIDAYLRDVYTLPEYRCRGYASEIVAAAKLHAESQGVLRMWLHATSAGRPVYEAAGFKLAS